MQCSIKSLMGYTLGASDGEIGKVKDFYFDDNTWTIRYVIVETGNWLSGRKVLISPGSLIKLHSGSEVISVSLTTEQIKNSPDIDTEKPVSVQQEMDLYNYYPWENYWGGSLWGGGMGTTGMMTRPSLTVEEAAEAERHTHAAEGDGNPHLRSTGTVKGYTIHAVDGAIGDVEDFIIDDRSWKIDFIVVDTGNWFPGKKVLISPKWIKQVEWETSSVVVNASVEKVKNSPEFDPHRPINEAYSTTLHDYYGRSV